MNFFGNDLTWSGPTYSSGYSEGVLSGVLADGSMIDLEIELTGPSIAVSLTSGPEGEELSFNGLGYSVPEPSSLLTLGTGLAGLTVAGAYRRRRLRRKVAA